MNSQEKLQVELADVLSRGKGVTVVTVTAADLSTPQSPGAKMLVYPDGSISGTVGGGPVEAFVKKEALVAFREGKPRTAEYRLVMSETGMYCGGKMTFFIEVYPAKSTLFVLGAGHVGRATARLAEFLGMPMVVVDDRPEYAVAGLYPSATVICEAYDFVFEKLPITDLDYVVIVTRCHTHDEICLEKAMKTPARYIGVIGSRTKIKTLFGRMNKRGVRPQSDPRVFAPIGLDLGDETVENIALSIHAEIAKLKVSRTGAHMREKLAEREEKAG
ncbi:XdhC family protein [bacterium]|nr:XdhC family protein [bacterium]